jgi:hypothetical protein
MRDVIKQYDQARSEQQANAIKLFNLPVVHLPAINIDMVESLFQKEEEKTVACGACDCHGLISSIAPPIRSFEWFNTLKITC